MPSCTIFLILFFIRKYIIEVDIIHESMIITQYIKNIQFNYLSFKIMTN